MRRHHRKDLGRRGGGLGSLLSPMHVSQPVAPTGGVAGDVDPFDPLLFRYWTVKRQGQQRWCHGLQLLAAFPPPSVNSGEALQRVTVGVDAADLSMAASWLTTWSSLVGGMIWFRAACQRADRATPLPADAKRAEVCTSLN